MNGGGHGNYTLQKQMEQKLQSLGMSCYNSNPDYVRDMYVKCA